jgi:hypothetical protein
VLQYDFEAYARERVYIYTAFNTFLFLARNEDFILIVY